MWESLLVAGRFMIYPDDVTYVWDKVLFKKNVATSTVGLRVLL